MTSSIGIVATFIILGSILLFNLIYTSIHWVAKFLFITITVYFSLVTFFSLEDLKGWPIETILPRSFIVLAVNVQEPVNQTDDGGIYLWCKDLTQYADDQTDMTFTFLKPFYGQKKSTNKPRNYEFKYNKKLHEKLAEIDEMIKQGKVIVGENKGSKKGSSNKKPSEKSLDKDNGYEHRDFEYDIKFYELPPAKLPEKVTQ